MMRTIPVSDLVRQVNSFLRRSVNLSNVMISGELSNVKYVNGHCYFDLKDEDGQLSCTLWKSYAQKAGFRLEDGMAVLVHGALTLYEKRGSLQLSVDAIEQAGLGALYLQLERLKQDLAKQGLFDQARKKPKPDVIQKVGLVTGRSTAALQDVLKTIRTRWPMLEVHLFNAPVQGSEAPAKIVKALQVADQANLDAVLLVRGGGSFEDLFCFNDPRIVKTLANMKTYTVTGIGHEIDTSLADLAADHRALTPTAAAQWVTLDQREIQARLQALQERLLSQTNQIFSQTAQHLMHLQSSFPLSDPLKWIELRQQRAVLLQHRLAQLALTRFSNVNQHLKELDQSLELALRQRLDQADKHTQNATATLWMHAPKTRLQVEKAQIASLELALNQNLKRTFQSQSQALSGLQSVLEALSPERLLQQGYAIVEVHGKPIRQASDLCVDQEVFLRFGQGQAKAKIIDLSLKTTS